MNNRFFNLASGLLTAMMIIVFVASPQAHGTGSVDVVIDLQGGDRCCQTAAEDQKKPSDCQSTLDCCPEPCEENEGPCSCLCSNCSVMPRTVNFFSDESVVDLLFGEQTQLFKWITDRQPASASLGVDVQPPIV